MTSLQFFSRYIQKSLRAPGGASTAPGQTFLDGNRDESAYHAFESDTLTVLDWNMKYSARARRHRNLHYHLVEKLAYEDKKCPKENKKKNKKQKKKGKKNLEAQSGVVEKFTMSKLKAMGLNTNVHSIIENTVAMFLAASESSSVMQFLSIMFLYLKTLYSPSVTEIACTFLAGMFGAKFTPQGGETFSNIPGERPAWLNELKDLSTTWTLSLHAEGFAKIGKLLSFCVALGMCKLSDICPTVGGLELFTLPPLAKTVSFISVIDAVFDLIIHFAEGGYMCFTTGSIKPLLYGSLDHQLYSDMFSRCLRSSSLHRAGNLALEGLDENDFDKLLSDTVEMCQRLLLQSKSPVEKSVFGRQLERLHTWQSDFSETRVKGGLRISPFSIGLFGNTAVGKSTLCPLLMTYVLKANGFCADDNRVITIKEKDKFMSTARSHINGIIYDDIGNTKAQFVTEAPTDKVIEVVNNTRTYANMAEADMKGKVAIQPKVFITTKNVKDGGASVYSNCPASIARRDTITITVKVRPEFAHQGMLDTPKIKKKYPDKVPTYPDMWLFDVQRAYPVEGPDGCQSTIGWENIMWHGKKLQQIDLQTLIVYLADATKIHFTTQEEVVRNGSNVAERMELCIHCRCPVEFQMCQMCQPQVASPPAIAVSDESGYEGGSEQTTMEVKRIVNGEHELDQHDWDLLSHVSEQCSDWGGSVDYTDVPEREYDSIQDIQRYAPQGGENSTTLSSFFGPRLNVLGMRFGYAPFAIGNYFCSVFGSLMSKKAKRFLPLGYGVLNRLEVATTDMLISRLHLLESSIYTKWTTWIPGWVFDSELGKELITRTEWPSLRKRVLSNYVWSFFALGIGIPLFAYAAWRSPSYARPGICVLGSLLISEPMVRLKEGLAIEKEKLIAEIAERRDLAVPMAKHIRDSHLTWICGVSVAVAALYFAIQTYRNMHGVFQVQGNLTPNTQEQVTTRDKEVNSWVKVQPEAWIVPPKSKTVSFADLSRMVCENTAFVSFEADGRKYHCDAFFPKSNVAVIPKHMWKAKEMRAKFIRRDTSVVGANFSAILSRDFSQDVPGTDMSVVWIPSGGDWKDLTHYLPLTYPHSCPGRLYYRGVDGAVRSSKLFLRKDDIAIPGVTPYTGGTYDLEWETFAGLCMAPVVSETIAPIILGFHLSGCPGKKLGAMGTLLKESFETAFRGLKSKPCLLLSKNDVPHDKQTLGVQFFVGGEVHRKSAVRFLEGSPSCRVYGPVIGMTTPRSTVEESPISSSVSLHCGVAQKWGPPKMREGYKWQESLAYSSQPSIGFPAAVLVKACVSYALKLGEIGKGNMSYLLSDTRPLTRIEVISGIDGKRYIDAMKASTSLGYPFNGPKSRIMFDVDSPEHQSAKDVDPKFWIELARVEKAYLSGDRSTQVFKACMKDEPTRLDKEKVRIFQAAPMVLQMGVRKYFLPLARLLSLFPTHSECAVGINAESPEWSQMDDWIISQGENRILAGDYSKYDLRMPAQLMFCAFRLLIDLARKCKYLECDISIMEGFASEICYAYTAYNGDLIKFLGSNPSGQNLTVYINSIVNSLILRSAFYSIYPNSDVTCFNINTAFMTYGDDVKGSVSRWYTRFNHLSVAKFLEEHDMKFTMPDKSSKPTKYMSSSDCDFLKRKTFFNRDIGCKVGILDDDSIFKSLHCQMKSRFVTPKEMAAQNIDGAMRSWFFHGRKTFVTRQKQLLAVAVDCEIEHMCHMLTRPYDEVVTAWCMVHKRPPAERPSLCTQGGEILLLSAHCEQTALFGGSVLQEPIPLTVDIMVNSVEECPCVYGYQSEQCQMFALGFAQKNKYLFRENGDQGSVYEYQTLTLQTTVLETTTTQPNDLRTENVQFVESNPGWESTIASEPDETFSQLDTSATSLANFFARPIRINGFQWLVGNNTPSFQFNPWVQFFQNPRVSNRIANFNLMRAVMHVKIVVTGTSFHYGKLLMSYHPRHFVDQFVGYEGAPQDWVEPLMVIRSQKPHVMLDASGANSATMTLPFFHPNSYVTIPDAGWNTLGRMDINSFTPLKHANGADTPVTISLFVWATDVVLMCPTSAPPEGLTPQGGTDEYTGVVSGPAAIVQHMAGKLVKAPVIGKYAMATQTLAGGVASAARYFGFSRPVYPDQAEPYTSRSVPNLANTNVHDFALKLSLDVKQETTVDSRVMGLDGTDELDVLTLLQKPSYFAVFNWPERENPEEPLWNIAVTPSLARPHPVAANPPATAPTTGYLLPPVAYFSTPFGLWRGTMKYRFVVAASAYHKGQLMVRWDPYENVEGSVELNLQHTAIINIEETKDFTIEVGWGQAPNYLQTVNPTLWSPYGTTRLTRSLAANGILEVRVLNPLVAPNDITNNDVRILVFVSAGENFEVCNPVDDHMDSLQLVPQVGSDVENPMMQDHPTEADTVLKFGECKWNPALLAIHNGDPVTSFRQCLKRYNYVRSWSAAFSDFAYVTLRQSDFPLYRGRTPFGVDNVRLVTEGGTFNGLANVCNMTLLNWITPAFVARRGGLRRMYVLPPPLGRGYGGHTVIHRVFDPPPVQNISFENVPSTQTQFGADTLRISETNGYPSSWNPSMVVDGSIDLVVNVELPFQSQSRYHNARTINTQQIGAWHVLRSYQRQDNSSRSTIKEFVSVAEDFSLAFFLHTPIVFPAALYSAIPP